MSEGLSETFSESVSTSTAEPIKPPVSASKVSSRPRPPSAAQIAASRSNGKKGTGPRDTTSTKFNAAKHGLLATGITELDDAEGYRDKLRELQHELLPVGLREEFLVKSVALEMVRLERARRLEAEFITEVINPPIHEPGPFAALDHLDEGPLVDPGIPATMRYEGVQLLVSTFQRYISTISLSLFRNQHELERVQRMRKGEHVPAPAAVDVTVTTRTSKADEPAEKVILEGSLSSQPDKQGEADPGTATEEDEAAGPPVDPPVEH